MQSIVYQTYNETSTLVLHRASPIKFCFLLGRYWHEAALVVGRIHTVRTATDVIYWGTGYCNFDSGLNIDTFLQAKKNAKFQTRMELRENL